jgi:CD109 antigen
MAVMNKVAEADVQFAAAPMSLESASYGGSGGAQEPRVRKDFPETWLWESFQVNASNYVLEKVVPDTLTSWVITGYSLSPETGIGITLTPSILETFRPFFITLNKPYSIVKGEIFGLQVLVHNYMKSPVEASVTLQNSDGAFEFHQAENKLQKELTVPTTVGPVEVKSLLFIIKPIKFGIIKLDVKAVSAVAGDALSQPLIVKPPGQKQTRNKAVLLDLRTVPTMREELKTAFPPKRVPGADVVKISVISDLLGSTISNLDKLLQMPCGCGEQNMLNFVPDIVILQYLEASGGLTPEIKKKAIRFLEAGYQRELTYRHADGSFSAFGESDASGSTWLTAFVVRSFVAAKPYITIDNKVIQSALQFLSQKQQADGSFVEHGNVLHSDMKGGAADSYSLSAYTLLAFVESANYSTESEISFDEVIKKGQDYISKAPTTLENPYPLTLISYALQATGHELKSTFKEALEKLAKHDGDLMYWEPPKKNLTKPILTYHWEPSTKPVSVEMTAYALLIYLKDNNLEKAVSVGKWLLTQRNAEGGFISTQDTVVGLTALAKFALATRAPENDLLIRGTHVGGINVFKVDKDNAMVLQESLIPSTSEGVIFQADGNGTVLAQLSWSYYVEEESEGPAFAITIKVTL